jgi:hypothetical protein
MIRFLSLCLVLSSFFLASAQSSTMKRKYRGIYSGSIGTYQAIIGNKEVSVMKQELQVELSKDSLVMEVGKYRYANTYLVVKTAVGYELHFERPDSGIEEVLLLDPKLKTLLRKGLFPQPDALLTKQKKK